LCAERANEIWRENEVKILTDVCKAMDSAQIVRCRDCRFSPDDGQTCERDGDEFNVTLVRPDGFCAWGTKTEFVTCKCGEDIERIGRIQTCPSCGRKVMA